MADATRCLAVPAVPMPKLPGISFTVPSVSQSFDAKLCCKLVAFKFATPPIPLPFALAMTLAAAIQGYVEELNAELALVTLPCPRNPPVSKDASPT